LHDDAEAAYAAYQQSLQPPVAYPPPPEFGESYDSPYFSGIAAPTQQNYLTNLGQIEAHLSQSPNWQPYHLDMFELALNQLADQQAYNTSLSSVCYDYAQQIVNNPSVQNLYNAGYVVQTGPVTPWHVGVFIYPEGYSGLSVILHQHSGILGTFQQGYVDVSFPGEYSFPFTNFYSPDYLHAIQMQQLHSQQAGGSSSP